MEAGLTSGKTASLGEQEAQRHH